MRRAQSAQLRRKPPCRRSSAGGSTPAGPAEEVRRQPCVCRGSAFCSIEPRAGGARPTRRRGGSPARRTIVSARCARRSSRCCQCRRRPVRRECQCLRTRRPKSRPPPSGRWRQARRTAWEAPRGSPEVRDGSAASRPSPRRWRTRGMKNRGAPAYGRTPLRASCSRSAVPGRG